MAQSIEQFAQAIKQKYPQYQNIPDTELGAKMLEKYPQYQSVVNNASLPAPEPVEDKRNIFQKGFDSTVGDFLKAAVVTPALKTGQAVAELGIRGANALSGGKLNEYVKNKTGQDLDTRLNQAQDERYNVAPIFGNTFASTGANLDVKDALKEWAGNALKTASYVTAPAVFKSATPAVSLLGKVGQGALKGALSGAISGVEYGAGNSLQNKDSLKDVGISALQGGLAGAVTGGVLGGITPAAIEAKNLIKPSQEYTIAKRTKALSDLDGIAGVKKISEKAKSQGFDVKQPLIKDDFLVGAVDSNGVIKTKGEGMAIQQYSQKYIDPAESVVSDILKKDGQTIKSDEFRKYLLKKITDSGIQGASYETALKNVDKEIAGYVRRSGSKDIPLSLIHDAKVDKYSDINFNTAADTQKYAKTLAQGLKEIIENKTTSADIKAINKELQKHFTVVDYLTTLDNKRVSGGRLGKYFAQTLGGIVGSHFGPLGSIAGAEAANVLQGSALERAFGGTTGYSTPQSQVLMDAIKYANAPRLQLQAPQEGALSSQNFVPKAMGPAYTQEAQAPQIFNESILSQRNRVGDLNTSQINAINPTINSNIPTSLPRSGLNNTQGGFSTLKGGLLATGLGAGIAGYGIATNPNKSLPLGIDSGNVAQSTPTLSPKVQAIESQVSLPAQKPQEIKSYVPPKYVNVVQQATNGTDISANALTALINTENGSWKEDYVNPQGTDTGLGQHNDNTYTEINKLFKKEYGRSYDRKNGEDNIKGTALYMQYLVDHYPYIKTIDDVVGAYRVGPGGYKAYLEGKGTDKFTAKEIQSMVSDKKKSFRKFYDAN